MAQPSHIKTFIAAAAIAGRKLVTFGTGKTVVEATAATDPIIGIAEQIGSSDNGRVDVIINGIAEAVAGGNITRGNVLTADATGNVVVSAQATDRIIGIAMDDAVAGDVVDVLIAQG